MLKDNCNRIENQTSLQLIEEYEEDIAVALLSEESAALSCLWCNCMSEVTLIQRSNSIARAFILSIANCYTLIHSISFLFPSLAPSSSPTIVWCTWSLLPPVFFILYTSSSSGPSPRHLFLIPYTRRAKTDS